MTGTRAAARAGPKRIAALKLQFEKHRQGLGDVEDSDPWHAVGEHAAQ
jgi:hypothetical protein